MNIPLTYIAIFGGLFALLFIAFSAMVIIFVLVSKNTHAFVEWKAKRKGYPICIYWNDNNTVEWKAKKVDNGLIEDKKYGVHIINPESNYVDRRTRNIIIPVSSSVGVTVPTKMAEVVQSLSTVIKDPKKVELLRKKIMNGESVNENFTFLKESVNFSSVKKMLTSITPHNINAKINLEVSRRLGAMGGASAQLIFWLILVGLGLIALFAFVYEGKNPDVVFREIPRTVANNGTKIIS